MRAFVGKTAILASMVTSLMLCVRQAEADFVYTDFTSATGLNLVGSAAVFGDRLRVIPALEQQFGSVWYQAPQSVSTGFSTAFDFQYSILNSILDADGHHGSDGIAFAIQPTSNTATATYAGFIVNPGLSIWFDAFNNRSDPGSYPGLGDDISSSRVGVYLDGTLLGQTDVEALGSIFRDGNVHRAQINYDGSSLGIRLDGSQIAMYQGVSLGSVSQGYAGFLGYDGAAQANQDVLNWSFSSPSAVPLPSAAWMSVGLLAAMGLRRTCRR